jgi:hypothetical protein
MLASRSASPRLRLTRCTGCSLSIGHVSTTTRAGAGAAASRGYRTRRARRVVGARRGDIPLVLNRTRISACTSGSA